MFHTDPARQELLADTALLRGCDFCKATLEADAALDTDLDSETERDDADDARYGSKHAQHRHRGFALLNDHETVQAL